MTVAQGKRANILVVEDSATDREMMTRVIEKAGLFRFVHFASDLAEARQFLSGGRVSLIFLDNSLPDGYGADFLSELAEHSAWQMIPVVLVTDWPSPFMRAKAQCLSVSEIWSKDDFTVGALKKVVNGRGMAR